jgi:hypothetical protein
MKLSVSLQLLDLGQSVRLLGRAITSSQGSSCTQTQKNTHTTQILNIHALSGIRTHCPGVHASEDSSCLRPLSYRDRPVEIICYQNLHHRHHHYHRHAQRCDWVVSTIGSYTESLRLKSRPGKKAIMTDTFIDFLLTFQANPGIVRLPLTRPRPLPSTMFPIHYFLTP